MGKPVIIEIIGKDGASKVLRPIANELRGMEDAGSAAEAGTRRAGAGMMDLATKVGGLASAYVGLSQVAGAAAEGFLLTASLDQNRRMLGTLFQDVEKGNQVYQEAIKWGQQFGFTQEQMASSAASAAGILRNSNQATEKSMEVLARLSTLNPAEGIEGAVIAVKELSSGDIVSLAERFNVSKQAANEMKDAIAAGADPIAVLDQALANMGVTSEVLANRMEGPNGAILRMKQSGEETKLALGNLLMSINAPQILEDFAAGLNRVAGGLNDIATYAPMALNQTALINQALSDGAARMMANDKTYQQYVAAMNSIGQGSAIMSEQAWNAAQALQAKGMSAQDATNAVSGLEGTEDALAAALRRVGEESGLTEQQQAALIERAIELAARSPEAAAGVEELVYGLGEGRGPLEDFTAGLEAMAINEEYATSTSFGYADAQYAAATATDENSAALDWKRGALEDVTGATYEETMASLEAALAAEQNARFHDDLSAAVDASAGSAYEALTAELSLMSKYNLTRGEVIALIAATNELNKARAGQQGNLAGAAAARAANRITEAPGGAAGFHERSVERAERAERSSGRRGGGGGRSGGGGSSRAKGGKSEAQKEAEREEKELKKISDRMEKEAEAHNKRMEKLDEQHIAKEKAIWDDYYKKQMEALKKFNADKFRDELSFKDSLKGMDAQARAAMIAEERKAWDEAQAIAQAGNPKLADEYYKLRLEQIKANQERADELAAIEKEITETTDAEQKARLEQERAYLQQLDAEHDKYDAEDLQKLKDSGDQLAQERDEQLAEEELRYAEAGAALKEQYAENVATIVEEGGKVGQAFADIAFAAEQAAAAARAAVDSIPSAGGAADAAGGGGPAPDGSYRFGLKHVPYDGFIGELHKGERILTANEARDYNLMEKQGGIRDSAPRSIGGGGTSIGSVVIAPTFPGSTAPRRDVDMAKGDLRRIFEQWWNEKAKAEARLNRGGR
jgi:hypothetical protein